MFKICLYIAVSDEQRNFEATATLNLPMCPWSRVPQLGEKIMIDGHEALVEQVWFYLGNDEVLVDAAVNEYVTTVKEAKRLCRLWEKRYNAEVETLSDFPRPKEGSG